MRGYVARRLALMVPTLLLVMVAVFAMVRLLPGDAVDQMLQDFTYAKDRDELRRQLGLDRPAPEQFVTWFGGVLRGDLGTSLASRTPVPNEIALRLPITVELSLLSIVCSILIGIPIGVLAAVRRDSPADYLARSLAIVNLAVPSFWLGSLVVIFGSLWLHWTPPIGFRPLTADPAGNLEQFVVPALVLAAGPTAALLRMTRAVMLELLHDDFVRTARAKGLGERVVLFGHALRNALIPVATLVGSQLPTLIGGAVIVETVFGLPGMGRYIVQALAQRDYPVIQGINLMFALTALGANLLVDLVYGYLDPRVKLA